MITRPAASRGSRLPARQRRPPLTRAAPSSASSSPAGTSAGVRGGAAAGVVSVHHFGENEMNECENERTYACHAALTGRDCHTLCHTHSICLALRWQKQERKPLASAAREVSSVVHSALECSSSSGGSGTCLHSPSCLLQPPFTLPLSLTLGVTQRFRSHSRSQKERQLTVHPERA